MLVKTVLITAVLRFGFARTIGPGRVEGSTNDTHMTTEQKANAVQHLSDASLDMKIEARAVLSKIAAAKARFAQEMADLDERFKLTCWNTVESEWTQQEIAEAAKK